PRRDQHERLYRADGLRPPRALLCQPGAGEERARQRPQPDNLLQRHASRVGHGKPAAGDQRPHQCGGRQPRKAVNKLRPSIGLTVALVLAKLVLSLGAASAQTRSLLVEAPALTGKPVPVALSLDEVRRAVGLAFPIDWDSLRVYDSDGNLIPYQIDDADLSGALSLHDRLAF